MVLKNENFSIRDLLDFVKAMFMPQMELVGNQLSFTVEGTVATTNKSTSMPDILYGD